MVVPARYDADRVCRPRKECEAAGGSRGQLPDGFRNRAGGGAPAILSRFDSSEGLLIRDFVNAEISIGRFAELMELNYEEARDWLHRHGIATSRQFTDPDLEQAEQENYRKISEGLGLAVP